MQKAAAVFLDGFGLLLGAKLLGLPVHRIHRMTGPDFLEPLVLACEQKKLSVYLLGGEPGVVDQAIQRMIEVAPSLIVHGHHGFFEKCGPENDTIVSDINSKSPDILYVGLGSPIQERWISQNLDRVSARVFLPMGAGLDHYTGNKSRGPRWLTDHGAEWLFRLAVEPRRLWRRYLVGNPRFFGLIFIELLRRLRCRLISKYQPRG
jgi:N-acetylglucosaminyldiphosphoundecaprenol N-acetyl-beta-D-mannosaminyltransferase